MRKLIYRGEELIELRPWQKSALVRSRREIDGIFLEALGGRGKTIATMAIIQEKKAERVLILNNKTAILNGWEKDAQELNLGYPVAFTVKTDKWLRVKANALREAEKGLKTLRKKIGVRKLYRQNSKYVELHENVKQLKAELDYDVLVIDEWQDMCSNQTCKDYLHIQRKYTIGLSATPIRRKGENFYPLEKTFFKIQEPSNRQEWLFKWGTLVYDSYSATKAKWKDFADYESYIAQLDNRGNFMCCEEIENIEQAVLNNGFPKELYLKRVSIPDKNKEKLKSFRKFNILGVDGEYVMGKGSMSNKHTERLLRQAEVVIEDGKLTVDNTKISPVMKMAGGMLERSFNRKEGLTGGVVVVCESKKVALAIYEHFKGNSLGLWTGDKQINHLNSSNLVATAKVMGTGVDGLQYRFDTMIVLDPKQQGSGEFNDYRQLQWRISGARQQHKVNIVEVVYIEE